MDLLNLQVVFAGLQSKIPSTIDSVSILDKTHPPTLQSTTVSVMQLHSTISEATREVNRTCVSECNPKHMKISSALIAFGVVAMLENILLIGVVSMVKLGTKSKLLTFLWNFSLADTLIAFTFVFYHSRTIATCPNVYTCGPRFMWEMFCIQGIFIASLLASYLFVTAVTIDTLIAIIWSLHYSTLVTTRRVKIAVIFIWTLAISISLLGVGLMGFWDRPKGHSVTTFLTASLCMILAAVVIITNFIIVGSAWYSVNRGVKTLRGSLQSVRLRIMNRMRRSSSQRPITVTRSSFRSRERRQQNRKLALTMAMFVAAFLISCLPWPLTLLLCGNKKNCALRWNSDHVLVMTLIHAIIIPLLYGFRIEEVNRKVKDILRKRNPMK